LSLKFAANNHYSNNVSKGISEVRKYAVSILSKCNSNEICSILLQLVQALRYEDYFDSPLKKFLLQSAIENRDIAISLYWYLQVESQGSPGIVTNNYKLFFEELKESLKTYSVGTMKTIQTQINLKEKLLEISTQIKKSKRDTSNIEKKKDKIEEFD
jgi:Phosphoinositide 3-kinase family, accessory domain (PIK domain).